jgi:LPS-assembly protein
MLMRLKVIFILTLILSPISCYASDWSQLGDSKEEVQLEADSLSYDRTSGEYQADGDVHLRQGDFEVQGEQLRWNQQNGDLSAVGDVSLESPEDTLCGSSANYNLQDRTGVVEDGYYFLNTENLHVRGQSIEQRGESEYRIKSGTFTTCDGATPSWKFGASQVDVTLGGYARAKNAIFYLKDIPVLYFPYLIYPVKTERESGLLIPSFGYSDKRGFQFSESYYQVLGINQDATFYLDYLSQMGIGKGLEYRYIFGNDNAGEAKIYHIDVDKVDGETIGEERYAVTWDHDGTLPGNVRMIADVEYVNDDDYFDDFGTVAEEYDKDEVQSDFSLTKSWGKYSLVGALRYTRDLEDDDDNDETMQLLPRITFDATRQRIGDSPLYYELDTQYSNFWSEESSTGQRLMLLPELSTTAQLFDIFSLTPTLAYRQRYYWNIEDPDSDYDETNAVGLPELTTTLNTRMWRTYATHVGGLTHLRHTLEPELTYSYIPDQDQSDIPEFDSYDQIDEEDQLEYALVQRLKGRYGNDDAPSYRDLIYLRTALIQDFTVDESGDLDELEFELDLDFADWWSLSGDGTYDLDTNEWSEAGLSGELIDSRGNSLNLLYSYDEDADDDDDVNYGRVAVNLALLDPFFLTYQQRYSFEDQVKLSETVKVEYRQQCWSLMLSYSEDDDGDRSMMLTFLLRGLGEVGSASGGFGS